jgi:hypothetical protein
MRRRKYDCVATLQQIGVSYADAEALRRISMTLHRWHELECGNDGGCIERDETSGKAFWLNSRSMRRSPIADRETGALKRLAKILERYPTLASYIQGDPRGAALYILRPGDVPPGCSADSYYNRGIMVCQ